MMDLQASMRSKERSKGKKSMSQMYHYHKKLTCKDSEENSIVDSLYYLRVLHLDSFQLRQDSLF